mgnify:CR=1 FL=1
MIFVGLVRMVKLNYYINSNGILKRKHNTIYFIRKKNGKIEKKILPIEKNILYLCLWQN